MYVIKNGLLYTMGVSGTLRADIRVDGGKITEIGPDLPLNGGECVDASGLVVTPGLVDAHSHIGGFPEGDEIEDLNEITNPLTPELDAYYGINPDSKDFEWALRQGITTSCLVPGSANVVCGWGIVLKSAGEHRLVSRPAVMKAAMGINPKGCYGSKQMAPMTRMAIANLMKTWLRNVREYMDKKAKKIPLKVHSYMPDMMTLLEIAKEFAILITVDHAQGASDFAEELTDPHVRGVIFGPTSEPLFPGEGGKLDYECCKILDDLGVNIAVMTDGPVTVFNMLLYEMGEAVRHGMDPVRAVGLTTINAAKILGIEDRVGSLEVGKDADILLWTKLPTVSTDAELKSVYIDGVRQL